MTEPIFTGELQLAGWSETHSGGAKVTFWLDSHESLDAFRRLTMRKGNTAGQILMAALVLADDEGSPSVTAKETTVGGTLANALHKNGFFAMRQVCESVGTDDQYLKWLRQQPCIHCGDTQNIEAAHVRRVANGAGTGIKPTFSAISLCHVCHALQHSQGESALGGKDAIDRYAYRQLGEWCKDHLRKAFKVESFRDINPQAFVRWATDNGIGHCLPNGWKA